MLQGVPKKTGILGKMPITGLGRGLMIKVDLSFEKFTKFPV